MDKFLFLIIFAVFLIITIFFREETGIRPTTVVVVSLALLFGFIKIFLKSNEKN